MSDQELREKADRVVRAWFSKAPDEIKSARKSLIFDMLRAQHQAGRKEGIDEIREKYTIQHIEREYQRGIKEGLQMAADLAEDFDVDEYSSFEAQALIVDEIRKQIEKVNKP